MIIVAICLYGSHHKLELIYHQVDDKVSEDGRNHCALINVIRIKLEHIHSAANVSKEDDNDEAYPSNVNNCSDNERHVERQIVK